MEFIIKLLGGFTLKEYQQIQTELDETMKLKAEYFLENNKLEEKNFQLEKKNAELLSQEFIDLSSYKDSGKCVFFNGAIQNPSNYLKSLDSKGEFKEIGNWLNLTNNFSKSTKFVEILAETIKLAIDSGWYKYYTGEGDTKWLKPTETLQFLQGKIKESNVVCNDFAILFYVISVMKLQNAGLQDRIKDLFICVVPNGDGNHHMLLAFQENGKFYPMESIGEKKPDTLNYNYRQFGKEEFLDHYHKPQWMANYENTYMNPKIWR